MLLTPLVFVAAITLEVLGSYMSVVGLSSKSSLILIVLAIALDFSKIVVASVLYKNWKDLNVLFKTFLLPTTIFLMVITSYGAYAYLLQEFGKTTANGEQISTKLALLEAESIKVNSRKQEIDAQISSVDPAFVTQKRRLNNMFAKELEYLNNRSIELDKEIPQLKASQMSDNLQAGTLGSLAKSWGTTPDQTAKIIALMMVVVIDPLAIVMLTVGNFLLAKKEEEKLLLKVKKEQIKNLEINDNQLNSSQGNNFTKSEIINSKTNETNDNLIFNENPIEKVTKIQEPVQEESKMSNIIVKDNISTQKDIDSVANTTFSNQDKISYLNVVNNETQFFQPRVEPDFRIFENFNQEKNQINNNLITSNNFQIVKNSVLNEELVEQSLELTKDLKIESEKEKEVLTVDSSIALLSKEEKKSLVKTIENFPKFFIDQSVMNFHLNDSKNEEIKSEVFHTESVQEEVNEEKLNQEFVEEQNIEKNEVEQIEFTKETIQESSIETNVNMSTDISIEEDFIQENSHDIFNIEKPQSDFTNDVFSKDNTYWIEKYGMTQEQFMLLERPGDYLTDNIFENPKKK